MVVQDKSLFNNGLIAPEHQYKQAIAPVLVKPSAKYVEQTVRIKQIFKVCFILTAAYSCCIVNVLALALSCLGYQATHQLGLSASSLFNPIGSDQYIPNTLKY